MRVALEVERDANNRRARTRSGWLEGRKSIAKMILKVIRRFLLAKEAVRTSAGVSRILAVNSRVYCLRFF